MPIHVTTSTTQSLSNKTFVDLLSTTGIVYSQDGNSTQWNSAYTAVYSNSGKYDSTFTTVNTNSSTWDYQGTDIKALTSNWQNTYTTVNTNSSRYDSVFTTVNTNSSSWVVDTDSQTLSFNENNATLSITNGNTVSLSALSGGSGTISNETDPVFITWAQANSGRYDSIYTTFNSNSSNYQSTYTTVSAITGNLILGQLGISIDGASSGISTGIKQYLRVPYNCTITSYDIVARPSGNITIDILKSAYEDFPPTTSITGGFSPAITGINNKARGNPLGWSTTTLTAGEYLGFNVTSISTITAATLTLATRR